MIELRGLTKRYGEKPAVDGVDLTVPKGEVCVLIGPSGCGKTTTLKMINRMLEPTSGSVYVNGKDVLRVKPETLRRSMGYVIQYVGLFPHMRVAENIGVVPGLLGWEKARIAKRTDELLGLVGLDPPVYRDKFPRELSGGEAQRVGVARALAADPPLLLMDEPFGAVDPLNRMVLQNEFVRIQRDLHKTVVFVTHDLDEAIRVADSIVIMREGRIVQHDTPERVLAGPANKFVHDFVGQDRALKRLARYGVREVMTEPAVVRSGNLAADARDLKLKGGPRYAWVVDDEGRLTGWLNLGGLADGTDPRGAVTETDASRIGLGCDATLREALSRMLSEGIRAMPVVDESRKVIGEISLKEIEKITERVEPA